MNDDESKNKSKRKPLEVWESVLMQVGRHKSDKTKAFMEKFISDANFRDEMIRKADERGGSKGIK